MRLSYIILERLGSFLTPDILYDRLAFLKACGYDGVELNLTAPLGLDEELLQRWLADLGLVVPSFLTGEAYGEGLCLSVSDADVRRRAIERLIDYVEIARRFQAKLVVGLLQGTRRDEPNPHIAHQRIAEGLRRVVDVAESRNVEIVIEPVNHLQVGFHNSVAEVLALCLEIGSSSLRPMVDTIHMNIEESSLIDPILACGADLAHVHLCESNGGAFGSGHIDFSAVWGALRQIEYQGFASVKVYRHASFTEAAQSSITMLREILATGG